MHRNIPRILILGDGLLGKEIHKQSGWDIISRKQNGFDITHPDKFIQYFVDVQEGVILFKKYDIIVNCIAYTDTYSSNKQENWNVNYKGVADLVDFCNKWDIKLVHISTDYVYINSKSNASENDVPIHGDNWYSYTKLLADAYVELKSNNYLICRETHKPTPFPYSEAWINHIGNFDYVNVIANYIIKLINTNATGIFNVGTKLKTIFDLAKQTNPEVRSIFKPKNAPTDTSLNTAKLDKWLFENKIFEI